MRQLIVCLLLLAASLALRADEASVQFEQANQYYRNAAFGDAARDPNGFPALNEVPLDGGPPVRLATRYLGSTSGVRGPLVVFDQQDRLRAWRSLGLRRRLRGYGKKQKGNENLAHQALF